VQSLPYFFLNRMIEAIIYGMNMFACNFSELGSANITSVVVCSCHFHLSLLPPFRSKGDAFCRYMCYVNPFVLHGAYANYLKVWAHAGARSEMKYIFILFKRDWKFERLAKIKAKGLKFWGFGLLVLPLE